MRSIVSMIIKKIKSKKQEDLNMKHFTFTFHTFAFVWRSECVELQNYDFDKRLHATDYTER